MSMTTLPLLAQVEDLSIWPGVTVADADEEIAMAVLGRASAIVRREAGRTFLNAAGHFGDVPDGIASLVVQISARFWNNPSGVVVRTAGQLSEQFNSAVVAGVYLTQGEKDEISSIVSGAGSRPKIWTMATTRDPRGQDNVWLFDQMAGSDPILSGQDCVNGQPLGLNRP